MNALIKKAISVILILFLMTTVFAGCNTPEASAISAPVCNPGSQITQNGNLQALSTDGAAPETDESKPADDNASEPTEPEATEPKEEDAAGVSSLLDSLKDLWPRFLEFFDWWTVKVNNFFDLIDSLALTEKI